MEAEFTRPEGFDLAAWWTAYQREFHDRLHRGEALVRLAPGVRLPRAAHVRTDPAGRTLARVPIESVEHAHGEFLRLGADIEVLEPPPNCANGRRTGRKVRQRGCPVRRLRGGTRPSPQLRRFTPCSTRTRTPTGILTPTADAGSSSRRRPPPWPSWPPV
ncbi:WYL domain-containing protein [Streptomyces sp. NPDC102270]|uniref:WYL domain-containing protein n=1 Tax=Streptomyces sp. NPDC102270 TaxID=3366150 RepID=UPI00382888C4